MLQTKEEGEMVPSYLPPGNPHLFEIDINVVVMYY